MISNERSAFFQPKPPQQNPSETLKAAEFEIEWKQFVLMLKENMRGRYLSISENTRKRRSMIVVPETGLKEFAQVVAAMVQAVDELPANPLYSPKESDSDFCSDLR